ncbi:MAG: cobalamin biosynthesis protein CbiD [Vallitaleaceae bacterium]|nr:cobalamin biosynthesis protein CbiD [Vallitaleaceae bacterium]
MSDTAYVFKNGKRLRTGYTTGSCAAAAAAGAAWMLKHQQCLEKVTIDTPKGWRLTLDLVDAHFDLLKASCAVVKDSGDDPDITNGIQVVATVCLQQDDRVTIVGGKGVGRVTQKGLQISVGQSAINPTPLKMIEAEIRKIYEAPQGIKVIIELPEGEALAKKTFNPRLGIEGGLSILGTSGIVEPMSEDALKETILLELKVLREKGYETVVLVPGNIGEKQMASTYKIDGQNRVKMSNYLGFTLEQCVALGFKKVLVGGHIGKLIKPAGGIFYTHNRVSTTRMEILVAHLALMGMAVEDLKKIIGCRTTDEALPIIESAHMTGIYNILANKAVDYCRVYCFDQIEIEFALFSMTNLLGESEGFLKMKEDFLLTGGLEASKDE